MSAHPTKATELLEKQHRLVEDLFEKLESKKDATEQLVFELADNLAAHQVIEEKIFYPEVKRALSEAEEDEGVDRVLESVEEHALAKVALSRLLATSIDEESFSARVMALKDLIEHHVEEEEEILFPKVEEAIDDDELTSMGTEMKELFDATLERGHSVVLADDPTMAIPATLDDRALASRTRAEGKQARASKRTGASSGRGKKTRTTSARHAGR